MHGFGITRLALVGLMVVASHGHQTLQRRTDSPEEGLAQEKLKQEKLAKERLAQLARYEPDEQLAGPISNVENEEGPKPTRGTLPMASPIEYPRKGSLDLDWDTGIGRPETEKKSQTEYANDEHPHEALLREWTRNQIAARYPDPRYTKNKNDARILADLQTHRDAADIVRPLARQKELFKNNKKLQDELERIQKYEHDKEEHYRHWRHEFYSSYTPTRTQESVQREIALNQRELKRLGTAIPEKSKERALRNLEEMQAFRAGRPQQKMSGKKMLMSEEMRNGKQVFKKESDENLSNSRDPKDSVWLHKVTHPYLPEVGVAQVRVHAHELPRHRRKNGKPFDLDSWREDKHDSPAYGYASAPIPQAMQFAFKEPPNQPQQSKFGNLFKKGDKQD